MKRTQKNSHTDKILIPRTEYITEYSVTIQLTMRDKIQSKHSGLMAARPPPFPAHHVMSPISVSYCVFSISKYLPFRPDTFLLVTDYVGTGLID